MSAHMTSYVPLITTMFFSCTTSKIKHVICQKSSILTYPAWIWHSLAMTACDFHQDIWHKKTRACRLCGLVSVILCLTVLIQYWLVADRQTGPRHSQDHIMTLWGPRPYFRGFIILVIQTRLGYLHDALRYGVFNSHHTN